MRTLLLAGAPLLLAGAILLPAGCSRTPKTAWHDSMERWFSSSAARPTDPPYARWTRQDHDLFLRRIGHADVAAVGTIRLVTTYSMYGATKQVGLLFRPQKVLHGSLEDDLDEQEELPLRLSDSAPDFRLALLLRDHLPGKRYLIFLKEKPSDEDSGPQRTGWRASLWRPPPPPPAAYRWALYRPEPALLARVREMYHWLDNKKK